MDFSADMALRGQSAIGLIAFMAVAWIFSEGKGRFPIFSALWTVAAQLVIAGLLLYTPLIRDALGSLTQVVQALQAATDEGTKLVFGYLGGGEAPFEVTNEAGESVFGAIEHQFVKSD